MSYYRWVNTYTFYKGKAFVSAQIRRRRLLACTKISPGFPTQEQIQKNYVRDLEYAKVKARRKVDKYGPRIQIMK
jgi:hypothetical protein